jgi:cytochrome o ubiquinol oxidase operon protein cyoD
MSLRKGGESSAGSFHSYLIGFILSLSLTLVAFAVVNKHVDSGHQFPSDNMVLIFLAILATAQLLVQLVFFLHLDRESNRRWNAAVLGFAAIVVLILVLGSLWIISNLDTHHYGYGSTHDGHELTSPSQTNQYIIHDEGINQ